MTSVRAGRRRVKILFLAANALRERPLRLDEELRAVDRRLRAARFRDVFELVSCSAVRLEDLQRSLLEYAPDVVHFAGHGDADAGLALLDEDGLPVRLSAEALASLFEALCGRVRLVIFNACFSAEHAAALCESVEFAVGMGGPIDDQASLGFAGAFYEALAYGCSVRKAFECGVVAIKALSPTQAHLPQLCTQRAVEAEATFLDAPRGPGRPRKYALRLLAGLAALALTVLTVKFSSSRGGLVPPDAVARCRSLAEGQSQLQAGGAKGADGQPGGPPRDIVAQLATLHRLADSYRRAHKSETYGLAEPLYRCVLDLREKTLGDDHLDTAKTLAGLGILYAEQGKDDLAEPKLRRARDLLEKAQRPPRELVDVLHALADLHKARGETEREQELLLRALEIKTPGSSEMRAETTGRLEELVERYRAKGDDAKADTLRARIETFRKATSPSAMVRIAGGAVRVGAFAASKRPAGCAALRADEDCTETTHPERARVVEVSAFDLDANEVTNEAFASWLDESMGAWYLDASGAGVVRSNEHPSTPLVYAGDGCDGGLLVMRDETTGETGQEPNLVLHAAPIGQDPDYPTPESQPVRIIARAGHEQSPAVCVTWQGASNYCRAQGKRLPSDAEWELAAKGAQGRPFPWGAELPRPGGGVAFGGRFTALVGPRGVATSPQDRTPEGVFDLGGNVAEWTQSANGTEGKIVRGGSWASANLCHVLSSGCAFRPMAAYANDLGFRCARSSTPSVDFR